MSEAASWMGNLAERGLQKLTYSMEKSSVGKIGLNLAGNQEWELDLTPEGRTIQKMQSEYIRLHDKALGEGNKQLQQLREWHRSSDAARNSLPIKTATMAEYHQHAVATGHPIQNVTQAILNSDVDANGMSRNAALTQRDMMVKNESLARLAAIHGSYGDNFENVAPILARMRLHPNPNIVDLGQRYADIVSNQVRDTKLLANFQGGYSDQSVSKTEVNKQFQKANKVRALEGLPEIPKLRTDPTYMKPAELERKAHRIIDMMLLPTLAIKHVGQFFNIPMGSPLSSIGAALLRMQPEEMDHTIEASHILASTVWREMYQDILGETGHVAQWTNSPTSGKILSRIIHQPGFTTVRKFQIQTAGAVGFHSAIYWAHNFAESGSKIAEARLRELQIDPQEVLKQGGKLTPEQLEKGVYHYANNRMFFNKSIDNSLYQNRNVWTRSGFMYHSFLNNQTAFMRREVLTMLKAGDLKGLAQLAGTVAVLFPNVAPLLAGAEKFITTGSVSQAGQEVQNRYQRLYDPKNWPDWLENYVTLLTHIGAVGVYFSFFNAVKANRIPGYIAGPAAQLVGTDLYDALYVAGVKENPKPLERDILKQTVPIAGSALAHTLVPTEQESGRGPGSRSKFRLYRRGRRF